MGYFLAGLVDLIRVMRSTEIHNLHNETSVEFCFVYVLLVLPHPVTTQLVPAATGVRGTQTG